MARVAAMTSQGRLQLSVEWESPVGITSPELAATWCRLEVRVDQRVVTAVDDLHTDSMRRGIYTSAYVLAEWIAEHWWQLRCHLRPSTASRSLWTWSAVRQAPWLASHNMRAAGGGLAWPDLTLVPEGAVTRLVWNAGPASAQQPVSFLTSGDEYLASADVTDALGRFVDQVVVRLGDVGVVGTALQAEWAMLQGSDDDENAFAAAAARLGIDPYDAPGVLIDDLLTIAEAMDGELLAEFLDSVDTDGLRAGAAWLGRASDQVAFLSRPAWVQPRNSESATVMDSEKPWRTGCAIAAAYREQLDIPFTEAFPTADYVGTTTLPGAAGGVRGLVEVAGGTRLGLVVPGPGFLRSASLRFAQAQALGLSLLTDRSTMLLDPARTDLSKTARAFSAELLAPAAGLVEHFGSAPESGVVEAAAEFYGVSPILVQHQYDNQLALA